MWGFCANAIGCSVMTYWVYCAIQWIYVCFIREAKDLKKEGEWAVVTGATDGIGKAIAKQLLKKGLNVLLISRTKERLDETAKEFATVRKDGKVETLVVDFSKDLSDEKKCAQLKAALESKDIGVLVNNVGMSYDYPTFFHELDSQRVKDLLTINVDSCVWMTHTVLPKMAEKKRGCIVNISSSSAANSCPLLAEYSAAKEFLIRFSESLSAEYESKNVKIQAQVAHFVTSKLSKIRNPSITTPTPDGFAAASVKAMGHPEAVISPYWSHYVIVGVMRSLPTFVANKVCMSLHIGLRKRALKKKESAGKSE